MFLNDFPRWNSINLPFTMFAVVYITASCKRF
jgi:hypothetical protein